MGSLRMLGHNAPTHMAKEKGRELLAAAPDYECLSTSDMNHDRTKRTPPPKTTETNRATGMLWEGITECGLHKYT